MKVVNGVFLVDKKGLSFPLKEAPCSRDHDAYYWMQQIHRPSKSYPYMSVFEEELLRLHDELRNHPGRYARVLETWLKRFDAQRSVVRLPSGPLLLREGATVLCEAMEFLKAQEGHFKPKVKQLTPSKALCYGCQLHCHAAGRLGLDAHVSPSLVSEERFAEILRTLKVRETTSTRQASVAARSTVTCGATKEEMTGPNARASAFLVKEDQVAENCCFGPLTPLEAVLSLVVDDGEASRGHRRNIFDHRHRFVGVAHGLHLFSGVMSVMAFSPKETLTEKASAELDGLHRAFRGRLTVADFVAGDALLDIVRPRMCVGCGGIQLGDGMRKYRGLDEQGVEMENAYCHPECDVCPQCGERLEESGENLCTRFTRNGMTKRCHQRCIAQAFGMYCKLCGAPKSGNFMEYNDFNRPALEPIMDLIVVKAKVKTLREGDLLCHACVEPLFQAHRRRVDEQLSALAKKREEEASKVCVACGKQVRGVPVIFNGALYHKKCHSKCHSKPCVVCKQMISEHDERLIMEEETHVHRRCADRFRKGRAAGAKALCGQCGNEFSSTSRRVQVDALWMHEECYQKSRETRCRVCRELIRTEPRVSWSQEGGQMHKRCMDLLSQEDKAKMFAETNSRVEPFSVQKIDLHRCVHCEKDIATDASPTLFEGRWYHKVCWETKLKSWASKPETPSRPGLQKSCQACGREILMDAVLVKDQWLHRGCFEQSQVVRCAFCQLLIQEVSQKAMLDEKALHTHCIRPFLEKGSKVVEPAGSSPTDWNSVAVL